MVSCLFRPALTIGDVAGLATPGSQLRRSFCLAPDTHAECMPGNERWILDHLKMWHWHDEFARRRQVFVFPRLKFFDEVPR
jgi:hypothetical protein